MQQREQMIESVKYHLQSAQTRMKVQADKHRSEREFQVGEWVWLKLQPYTQQTVHKRVNQKLSYKLYGPFLIQAIIGKVAYKLKLLTWALIHDVFHISQLKMFYGDVPVLWMFQTSG